MLEPLPSPSAWMKQALAAAEAAAARGEVPVGAVLVDATRGARVACDGNQVEATGDPTAHAEMCVLRRGFAAFGRRLDGCDLYVTLEPCAMCAGAISLARIRRLYFAAYDAKGGGVEHGARVFDHATCLHRPEVVGGLLEAEAGLLLRRFFARLR